MSTSTLVRNFPYAVTSRGVPVEENSDEHEITSARQGIGSGEEQDASVDRCSKDIDNSKANKKGDTSNEVKRGTFLTRLDKLEKHAPCSP
jgi:hypothetical protein